MKVFSVNKYETDKFMFSTETHILKVHKQTKRFIGTVLYRLQPTETFKENVRKESEVRI